MQNPELCRELLQRILPNLKIDRIEYPQLQKSINVDMDAHSVRLDVYVKDDRETVYDIEMQVSDTKELPKRSRYYQGMIDIQLVDAGQHYKKLNKSYIIFICPFDLYGKGRHIYTFENICKEDNSISMGDEAVIGKRIQKVKPRDRTVSPFRAPTLQFVQNNCSDAVWHDKIRRKSSRGVCV